MRTTLVIRPQLSVRIAAEESRTEAFARTRFGKRRRATAITLEVPIEPSRQQWLLLHALLELVVRMDPIIAEIRISTNGPPDAIQNLVSDSASRVPLLLLREPTAGLPEIPFGIGPADCSYVDANDWVMGFSTPVPTTSVGFGAGAIFGALEAAKYLFLRAVETTHDLQLDAVWPAGKMFDVGQWRPASSVDVPTGWNFVHGLQCRPLVLVGCGGVGAGYLWFLRKSGLSGTLTIIDHDTIEWHNMNRLYFASILDADGGGTKVEAAANYMAGPWRVFTLARKAEHDDSISALRGVASAGGLIASAVGEPETRKFLARRGFARFFDAATNSDGSAQVLALVNGKTTCIDCHVRARPVTAPPGGCGVVQGPRFAGVVPHLSAYAGALLALEQLRSFFDPSNALAGANTQSVMRPIDAVTREPTTRCAGCSVSPHDR